MREHFETDQTPTRLIVFPEEHFFAVFQATLLNKNGILTIIGAKFVKNPAIFDQKRSLLLYFD